MVVTNQGLWDGQGRACVTHGRDEKYRQNTRKFKLFMVFILQVFILKMVYTSGSQLF